MYPLLSYIMMKKHTKPLFILKIAYPATKPISDYSDAKHGFLNNIYNLLDWDKHISAIYMDLKKSFDTVYHEVLLRQLDHIGFRGDAHHCINPFMPIVQTFAVRETNVSRHNGSTSGSPLSPSETIAF